MIRPIEKALHLCVLFVLSGNALAVESNTYQASCLITVDNHIVLRGLCTVVGDADLVQIYSKEKNGPFFRIDLDGREGDVFWNGPEPYGSRADNELHRVVTLPDEDGACYFNIRVKICYWITDTDDVALAATPCQVVSVLTGDMSLAEVTIAPDPPFEGYKTYLVRNHARDPQGWLTDWVKAELVPARWGFDVKLPSGERIGQVMINVVDPRTPKNAIEISPVESDCRDVALYFRTEKSPNRVSVFNGENRIGTISNFPHSLLLPQ